MSATDFIYDKNDQIKSLEYKDHFGAQRKLHLPRCLILEDCQLRENDNLSIIVALAEENRLLKNNVHSIWSKIESLEERIEDILLDVEDKVIERVEPDIVDYVEREVEREVKDRTNGIQDSIRFSILEEVRCATHERFDEIESEVKDRLLHLVSTIKEQT